MNDEMTDYVVLTVENPAFQENLEIMTKNIVNAGGTSPTIISANNYRKPMIGTKEANGRQMLHFRLPLRLESVELIAFLEQGMSNPKPPVTVASIRSAYKILPIVTGTDPETGDDITEMHYLTMVTAQQSQFLPYMDDVTDNTDPDNPVTRPPNMSDVLHLSCWVNVDPILLS